MSLLLALTGSAGGDVTQTGVAGSLVFTGQAGQGSITNSGANGSLLYTGQTGSGAIGIAQTGVNGSIVYAGQAGQGNIVNSGANGAVVIAGQSGNAVINYIQSGVSGSIVYEGQTGEGVVSGQTTEKPNEVYLKRWYVRKNGRVYVFNSAQEADAYIEADKAANEAIAKAQATSKAAKKKIRRKIYDATGIEPESVSIDYVSSLVSLYGLQFDVPNLIAQNDFETFMMVAAMAQQIEEEEIEMLLMA